MIYRKHPPPSFELKNLDLIQNMQREICSWLQDGANKDNIPLRPLQVQPTRSAKLMKQVFDLFDKKCVYCEEKLEENEATISFFRPRRSAAQEDPSLINQIYYIWLAWYWDNLYLSCQRCAFQKSNKFPIKGERRGSPGNYDVHDLLLSEQPLLIDPCLENPASFFDFVEDGTIAPKLGQRFDRAQATINILDLNYENLVRRRAEDAKFLKKQFFYVLQLYDNAEVADEEKVQQVKALISLCQADKRFAGMRRNLLLNWIDAKLLSPDTGKKEKVVLSNHSWKDLSDLLKSWAVIEPSKHELYHPCEDDFFIESGSIWPDPPEPGGDNEILNKDPRSKLQIILSKHFSIAELDQLCFDLNIKPEDFSTDKTPLPTKIRELITYCERRACLKELVDKIEAERTFLLEDLKLIRQLLFP